MKKLVALLMAVAGICVVAGAFFFASFLIKPASHEDKKIIFLVQQGSFGLIASQLQHIGVIKDARMFSLYARLTAKTGSVKIGEYEFNTNMTPSQVLSILTSGKSITYPITIPEGTNMYEISMLLESRGFAKKEEFLALCKNREFIKELLGETLPSLEGYLFPNTYIFTKFTGTKEIIREMVKQFLNAYAEASSGPMTVPMKRHEAVTLASIIEKETGAPEERGLVSSVFHNRLKKRMMLQTDPTVIYGVFDTTGVMPQNIRKSDLLTPNRYNTYTFKGLPFGPISNPGKEAIIAAFNPEDSEFLFFVSKNDGTHTFTTSYQDHSKAVSKFQVDKKQRQGKSWRDLSKKNKSVN